MRLNRGDRIAGVDALRLRRYFQRFGSEQVTSATVAEEFSVTKRQAERILAELLKLEMIRRCEFQHDKKMVCYQTTIKGNALGMAKAGKPVTRASADPFNGTGFSVSAGSPPALRFLVGEHGGSPSVMSFCCSPG
jgi:hypothetical protein